MKNYDKVDISDRATVLSGWLRDECGGAAPSIVLVLGSGFNSLMEEKGIIDSFPEKKHLPYSDLGFDTPGVKGHEGELWLVYIAGVPILVLQGRIHRYEGGDIQKVVLPIRTVIAAGVKICILTCAVGGITDTLRVGQLTLIKDHINFWQPSCLVGVNDESVGPRFPSMGGAYDATLRTLFKGAAEALGQDIGEGILAGVLGPQYETEAEIEALRALKAHMVGMSVPNETIAARHRGARVLGVACVTNVAGAEGLSHEDVLRVMRERCRDFGLLLQLVLPQMR